MASADVMMLRLIMVVARNEAVRKLRLGIRGNQELQTLRTDSSISQPDRESILRFGHFGASTWVVQMMAGFSLAAY